MYTEAEWKSQPSCYAQNGTDSQGSARVELGGDSCEVNVLPPTKGQGARKKTTGGTIPEAGKSAPVDGVGRAKGTQTGNTKTGTCGDNHVGYCLTRKMEEQKKTANIHTNTPGIRIIFSTVKAEKPVVIMLN